MLGFDNLEHANLTDVGVRRGHNEDNKALLMAGDLEKWMNQGHLFLVADGMGAHATGEKASEMATQIIPHTYHKHAQQGPIVALRKAFIEANATIHSRGQQNREFEGMGTTGTALLLRQEGAWVGHVGDSRAYRIRDGAIEQLTFDHSLVWVYAKQQRIDPEKVENIPHNVIVRSLGPEPLVQVDVEGPHPLQPGDVYVLCSDGLSGPVADQEIGAVASALPAAEACKFLIDLANLRGGPDNITVMVVHLGGNPAEGTPDPSRPRKPIFSSVPWPLPALLLAILLAGGAVASITWLEQQVLAGLAFFLAFIFFVAGIIGLVLQFKREKEQPEDPTDRPPAKAHRKSPCRIERPLVDRVIRAVQMLKQRAEERQWQVDWPSYQQHEQLAAKHLNEGNMVAAFQEYCRTIRPLFEALHRNRAKDDTSPPVWPKNGD